MSHETEIQNYYRSIGRCPRCHGKNKLYGNEKNCPECRAKVWAYGIKYRKEHPEFVERKKENDRLRRKYRIENHLCTECAVPLVDTRYKTCEKCRRKNKLRMRRSRANGI